MTNFNFEDGRGFVPAHQHTNPDNSVGGWIEDNCTVSENSVITPDSRVENYSRVNNSSVENNSRVNNSRVYNSRVDDNSRVYNSRVNNSRVYNSSVYNSSVDDNSRVDNSRVENNSSVENNSRVDNSSVDNSSVENYSRVDNSRVDNSSMDNSSVKHTKQVFSQSPIGSRNDRATAIWNLETKEILFVTGCFSGDEKKFTKSILHKHGHKNFGLEYLAFIQNAKNHFEIWKGNFE